MPPAPELNAVQLRLCASPVGMVRQDREFPAGLRITDMMAAAGLALDRVPAAHVYIDDQYIARELWRLVRPKAGRLVTIRVVPSGKGGEKNPLRTILTIAVIAAASWAAGAFGPALGAAMFGTSVAGPLGAAGVSTSAFGLAIGKAIVGGAVTLLGGLAVNAIAPPPKPRLSDLSGRGGAERLSGSLGLTAFQNRAAPYGPIPCVFGRVRLYPPLAASQVTEVAGNDLFVRALFELGYGPLEISEIKLGETPIENFDGIEMEVRTGEPGDDPITLYTNTIHEDGFNVELTNAGGPRSFITRTEADETVFDIQYPEGLIHIDAQGPNGNPAISPLALAVLVEYRVAGSGGGYTTVGVETQENKTFDVVRRAVRIVFPARAQYEVRLTRQTQDYVSNDRYTIRATSVLTVLRSITYTPPTTAGGRGKMAIRIKASNLPAGAVLNLNMIAQRKLATYDGAAFTAPVATRNAIWAALSLLRGPGNARPKSDDEIDLDSFKEHADKNDLPDQNGEPKFMFDATIDFRSTVFDLIRDILATCRCAISLRDGRFTVIREEKKTEIAGLITPRNSWGFRSTKLFVVAPHALRVRFRNPEKGFDEDETIVYADGYTKDNATLFETLELFGVTRASQSHNEGRFRMAQGVARLETYEVNCDVEHIVFTRGDLVRMQHDLPRWGLNSGRVKGIVLDDDIPPNVVAVELDQEIDLAAGVQYSLGWRMGNGAYSSGLIPIAPGATRSATVFLVLPLPESAGPAVGDLWAFGETGLETIEVIVKGIRRDGLNARLFLVDAAPGIHDADIGPLPVFSTQSTWPRQGLDLNPDKPAILDIRSDEDAMIELPGGAFVVAIRLTLQAFSGVRPPPAELHVELRSLTAGTAFQRKTFNGAPIQVSITDVVEGETYEIRARYVTAAGRSSDYTDIQEHTVAGKSTLPPNVVFVDLSGSDLIWSYETRPRDLAGFKVFYNVGANDARAGAIDLTPDMILTAPRFNVSAAPAGQVTFLVVALDTSGNESAVPGTVFRNFGGVAPDNIVLTDDLKAGGFPGSITGGSIVSGDLKASAAGLYLPEGEAPYLPVGGASYLPTEYLALEYQTTIEADAAVSPCRVILDLAVAGSFWSVTYSRGDTGLYLPVGADPYLPTGSDPYLPSNAIFGPWPGSADLDNESIVVRVSIAGGAVQGVISGFTVIYDVEDESEVLENVALASGGTRLPITKTYRQILFVDLTLQVDGSGANNIRVIDKDESLGPLVRAFNGSTGVAATIDARVAGIKG